MTTFLRLILGVFLLLAGTNKFFGFMSQPDFSQEAGQFMAALAETGYMFPMIGIVEIAVGAMLLAVATTPLALLLLAPLSVNIIAFHLFLDPSTIGAGAFVAILNVVLGVIYFDYYRSIFAKLFTEKVTYIDKGDPVARRPKAVVNS